MELPHRMIAAAEQTARRESGSFRHWSGRPRCAVCGRALAHPERELRVHGVPVHTGCAVFDTDGHAA